MSVLVRIGNFYSDYKEETEQVATALQKEGYTIAYDNIDDGRTLIVMENREVDNEE